MALPQLKIQNGCYRAEVTVDLRSHVSVGVLCDAAGTAGHYVALSPAQAAELCKFLCDHVPGVSEAILGKLVEVTT